MPTRRPRGTLHIEKDVHRQIKEFCHANDVSIHRWIEDLALAAIADNAIQPIRRQPDVQPVVKRPPPESLDEEPEEFPAWSQPPFWQRA